MKRPSARERQGTTDAHRYPQIAQIGIGDGAAGCLCWTPFAGIREYLRPFSDKCNMANQ